MPSPEVCDLLILNALIITLDQEDRILGDGGVAITGDRIVAVGQTADMAEQYKGVKTLDGRNFLVMPGLINTHNHTPLTVTRGMIEDLSFAPIYTKSIPQGHLLSEAETLCLARLGMYELLKAGCTTVVDFYRHPQMLATAAEEVGMRAVITGRIHDVDLDELTNRRWVHKTEIGEATLQETVDLIERWDGRADGRIRCDVAAHGTDTCSPELLRQVRRMSEGRSGNVHIHLAHSQVEIKTVVERDGMTPTVLLEEVGLLSDRLIAAHCVFLNEEDQQRLGSADVAVAHAPHQNAPAGNSAAVRELSERGCRITLCTDTRSGDLFEAMRLAAGSWRMKHGGYEPNARTLVRWATSNGADVLGVGEDVACVRAGYKADLILLDRRSPNLAPVIDGFGILAYSAKATNVDTVIIDGRIRLQGGSPVDFDGDLIVREAQSVCESLWQRYGVVPVSL